MPDEKETFGSWRTASDGTAHYVLAGKALCGARIKAQRPEPVRSEKSLCCRTPLCEECLDLNTERSRGAHGDASDAQPPPATDILVASDSSGRGSRNSDSRTRFIRTDPEPFMATRLGGIWPAMLTPTVDGGPSLAACEQLVELFAEQKLGGIYVAGSTGGWPLFSIEERKAIAERVVRAAAGRLPVMVHVGAVATADAVALAEHAARIGADAVSAVGPIYYPASPDALFEHYHRIGSATHLPFYAYHLSLVAKVNLSPREYVERLLAIPRIAGMKITDHDLYPFGLIHSAAGERLQLFSGADEVMCHAILSGATGAIGTFYNLWGPACAAARAATALGNIETGRGFRCCASRRPSPT